MNVLAELICVLTLVATSSGHASQDGAHKVAPTPKKDITLVTSDEVNIAASYVAATNVEEKRPAVILIHGQRQTKEHWEKTGIVETLTKEGYHLLSIDLRGRGKSGHGDIDKLRGNPALPILDIRAAIDWLSAQPGVDADRIALMGGAYGANLVAAGCLTQDWNVKTIVCFSATAALFKYLPRFPDRHPIPSGLFLAGSGQPKGFDVENTAKKLVQESEHDAHLIIFQGPENAQEIWTKHEKAREEVLTWLRNSFK